MIGCFSKKRTKWNLSLCVIIIKIIIARCRLLTRNIPQVFAFFFLKVRYIRCVGHWRHGVMHGQSSTLTHVPCETIFQAHWGDYVEFNNVQSKEIRKRYNSHKGELPSYIILLVEIIWILYKRVQTKKTESGRFHVCIRQNLDEYTNPNPDCYW